MMKTVSWTAAARPQPHPARLLLAALLRGLSVGLDRLARRLATVSAHHVPASVAGLASIEFHADAGAPEGALYVDGELIGRLPGVTRL